MVQSFRSVSNKPKSGLIQVASNIWTIEAKECVCYRPPMQPRYPYTHRAIVIRLNDGSLFILSPIQLTPEICADIAPLGVVKYLISPNHLHPTTYTICTSETGAKRILMPDSMHHHD